MSSSGVLTTMSTNDPDPKPTTSAPPPDTPTTVRPPPPPKTTDPPPPPPPPKTTDPPPPPPPPKTTDPPPPPPPPKTTDPPPPPPTTKPTVVPTKIPTADPITRSAPRTVLSTVDDTANGTPTRRIVSTVVWVDEVITPTENAGLPNSTQSADPSNLEKPPFAKTAGGAAMIIILTLFGAVAAFYIGKFLYKRYKDIRKKKGYGSGEPGMLSPSTNSLAPMMMAQSPSTPAVSEEEMLPGEGRVTMSHRYSAASPYPSMHSGMHSPSPHPPAVFGGEDLPEHLSPEEQRRLTFSHYAIRPSSPYYQSGDWTGVFAPVVPGAGSNKSDPRQSYMSNPDHPQQPHGTYVPHMLGIPEAYEDYDSHSGGEHFAASHSHSPAPQHYEIPSASDELGYESHDVSSEQRPTSPSVTYPLVPPALTVRNPTLENSLYPGTFGYSERAVERKGTFGNAEQTTQ
ncbi:uncharacterized protein EV422DRAFT_536650 [Fimicolochytrium jonesii]|uniref:uncharacterized protein n=1 Tax=Fimicolochytrium jonesii TaxID=1396493 RepID=UPI0022FF161D|nr:uncharacterized protein EV422DRAFT_536650 [Fimicolochytrium jonesii]KAI8818736.1 hypothetical protein EV422DRAFT_536650 [Fimicolochytrium jonesii]